MKLLLTSSGITNKTIKKSLRSLVGKPFKKSHLTFVPTAANVERGDKGWLVEDMNNFKKLGFATFDVIDISAVGIDYWLPSFEKADVLVFGGGNVSYLLKWLNKSGVHEVLLTLLETKVYVGISAGSMVTAENISFPDSEKLYSEAIGGNKNAKGLGLVGFEIRPHLNSHWFPKVRLPVLEKLANRKDHVIFAIDDNTAVSVRDGDIAVVSEGKWKKFN